jgi:hypothetical protein
MFDRHPHLGQPDRLPAAQVAFLAGYIAHLLLDVMWVHDIFAPVFGPAAGWGRFRDRLFLHNVLRAWCDRHDQARLIDGADRLLVTVAPDHWLPFTGDEHLRRWRDALVEQFAPGATIRTVEVFAERGHLPPEAFERVLQSPHAMDELIFSHISHAQIDDFYARGLSQSCHLVADYLDPVRGIPDAG